MGGEKLHTECRADERPNGPHRGPVMLIEAVRGITPAWAGKSARGPVMRITTGDHPRMGGEKNHSTCLATPQIGSPPHGRGKVS